MDSSISNKFGPHFLPALLLTLGLALAAFLISQTNFVIRDASSPTSKNGQITNTINVTGNGSVFTKPDMANLSITVSKTALTSAEAQSQANATIEQVKNVLKSNGIPDNDIKTSGFHLYPKYDYQSGRSVYIGQESVHSLTVAVKKIDDKATKVGNVIDAVVQISDVKLGGVYFDVENKEPYFSQARKAAYEKAKQKAQELANLSGVKLLKPVFISDSSYDTATIRSDSFAKMAEFSSVSLDSPTDISTGELEIRLTLTVNFGIE